LAVLNFTRHIAELWRGGGRKVNFLETIVLTKREDVRWGEKLI